MSVPDHTEFMLAEIERIDSSALGFLVEANRVVIHGTICDEEGVIGRDHMDSLMETLGLP